MNSVRYQNESLYKDFEINPYAGIFEWVIMHTFWKQIHVLIYVVLQKTDSDANDFSWEWDFDFV